jgi:hypothetical protein
MCGCISIVVVMLAFGKETNQPDAYFVVRCAIPSRLKTTCRRADKLIGTASSVRLCDASPAAARAACTSIGT